MKRCPQCSRVYGNDVRFCATDGTPLVEENLPLPSAAEDYETETVIRRDPIIVNVSGENIPPPNHYPNPPVETVIIEKPAKRRNPAIFLVLGTLFGGVLVLATLLVARNFYQNDNREQIKITPPADANFNETVKVSPTETPLDIKESARKHEARTNADDDEFNGRVIAANAYLRASPSRNADEIDVLPVDDRINIERRENEKSPWYYVTCEHGASGWMHGNTIEFTK